MSDLVSVVMPAHNAARFVGAAIESVINQTFANWELIIVDDGSTDDTSTIITSYAAKDPRIQVTKLERSGGPARARNEAIRRAKGRYVAFLDSDDMWLPEKLYRQTTAMKETGAVLSFTAYKKMDAEGHVGHDIIQVPSTVNYFDLLRTNVIGCLTAIYDKQLLGTMYMPEDLRREDYRLWLTILKRHHEDYALWLAILRKLFVSNSTALRQHHAIGINEVLAYYRVHNTSVSSNKFRAALMQWRVYRRVERLSLWRSVFYFLHYAYHGYRKAKMR